MLNLDLLTKYQTRYDYTYEERYYDLINPIYVRDICLCPVEMIKKESGNIVKHFRCISVEPVSISH